MFEPTNVASAPRFYFQADALGVGLGFSKLSGITSSVEPAEYWHSGRFGASLARQFGRAKPPSIALETAFDMESFSHLFTWHTLARLNNPIAKSPAQFSIMRSDGKVMGSYMLENAWCSKFDIDAVTAGQGMPAMRVTIECDQIMPAPISPLKIP
jgi:phage tail-like protein